MTDATTTDITEAWRTLAEVPGAGKHYEPIADVRTLRGRTPGRTRAGSVVYAARDGSQVQVGIAAADPAKQAGYNDSGDWEVKWVFDIRPPADDAEAIAALRAAIKSVTEESRHLAELGPDDERDREKHEERRAQRQQILDALREVI